MHADGAVGGVIDTVRPAASSSTHNYSRACLHAASMLQAVARRALTCLSLRWKGCKRPLRGAMLHELFSNDTTPATTDFACKECTVCAAGKALIAPATALIKIIVKTQRRIWSRCWAPPDMGLCGASMIWCEAMPWAPGGRVNSAVVCVASQRGAAPPVVPKKKAKAWSDNFAPLYPCTYTRIKNDFASLYPCTCTTPSMHGTLTHPPFAAAHRCPQIAQALEGTAAAGQVSNADLIALAGARAVAVCGGPSISVPIGRRDATAADPTGRMVSEKAGVEALKANFADKGLSVQEMVVLSGAHTIGARPYTGGLPGNNAECLAPQRHPPPSRVCVCVCLSV